MNALQKVDTFFSWQQLSNILTAEPTKGVKAQLDDLYWNSFRCSMRAISCSMKNKTILSFSTTIEKVELNCYARTHTRWATHKHTQPNIPHISLTVFSEDVYRLARDLFPIWQSQKLSNGLWIKCPKEFWYGYLLAKVFSSGIHTLSLKVSCHTIILWLDIWQWKHLKINPIFISHTCLACGVNKS